MKMKTKKAVAKRFSLTARGKIKRRKGCKGHLLSHKSRKRKRMLGKAALVDKTQVRTIRRLLPHG